MKTKRLRWKGMAILFIHKLKNITKKRLLQSSRFFTIRELGIYAVVHLQVITVASGIVLFFRRLNVKVQSPLFQKIYCQILMVVWSLLELLLLLLLEKKNCPFLVNFAFQVFFFQIFLPIRFLNCLAF